MTSHPDSRFLSRRQVLRGGLMLAGGAALAPAWPVELLHAALAQQAPPAGTDQLAAMRAQMAAAPIETLKLTDALTMLSGPGGNVVVLNGPDGKVVVDTFVQGVWDALKAKLDGIGPAPIKTVIDTHWHFDHADNNASFRRAGAAIIAHENTKKRLSQSIEVKALGLTFRPSPPEALPTETFANTHTLDANGEQIKLAHVPPAHTDTDIHIVFAKAGVLHMGDLFFNGMYPFIDAATGGTYSGMIAAADATLKLAAGSTKIVPGHGPLADKAALTTYRDMLVTVRDRVQKLKKAGRTLEEVVAAKPLADLDATWGKGFMNSDMFVSLAYGLL